MRYTECSFEKTTPREQMLFVGMDVHKDSHAAVGATVFGEKLFEVNLGNNQEEFNGFLQQVRLASAKRGLTPVFGLEDSTGYGLRLARYLFLNNITVKTVSPIFVDRERKYE